MVDVAAVKPRAMTLREAADRETKSLRFSSGSESLDGILGGGFKTGELVEIFGASGTAKTQLALQSLLSAAEGGFSCAYVDAEGQFRPERLSSICESRGLDPANVLPRVYSIRAGTTRQQSSAIRMVNENPNLQDCRMVVVDTVTKNFSLEYGGARMVAARQTALGAYLNLLARDAYLRDRAVLLLNRVASVGLQDAAREVGIGGETLRHFVQKVVRLQKRGEFVFATLADEPESKEVRLKISSRGLE